MKPIRNKNYTDWVKVTHRCLRCGSMAHDAHHVRWSDDTGMGTKPDDYKVIPLCRPCHNLFHSNPQVFAAKLGREEILSAMLDMTIEWFAEVQAGVNYDDEDLSDPRESSSGKGGSGVYGWGI